MCRKNLPLFALNRQEPTKTLTNPHPIVLAPGRGRDQICITVNHRALLHNNPPRRGWRSSSDNCLHKRQFSRAVHKPV